MRKKYILIAVLLLIPLLLTGCLSDGDVSNKNPVIKSLNLSSQTMRVGESIDVSAQASDPDGDKIGYSWSVDKGQISGSGANVTYQAPSKAGTYEIKVLVSDAKGGKVTSSKEIQVASNDSPVINSVTLNPTTIQVEETATVTVDASDPEGDILSYSYNATNGSISGTGSSVTYTAPSSTGTYTIEVTVSDRSNNVSASKDITVTPAIWQAVYSRDNTQYDDEGYDGIKTQGGNFIIVGTTSVSGRVIKIDKEGNMIWNKTFSTVDEFDAIKEANDGGYILAGTSYGGSDYDIHLMKIDSQGNQIWSQVYDSGVNEQFFSVSATSNGYTVLGDAGAVDLFVLKVDDNGNELSSNVYTISGFNNVWNAIVTSDNGFLVTGAKDDGTGNKGYVVKLDSSGVKQWDYIKDTVSLLDMPIQNNGEYALLGPTASGLGLITLDNNGNELQENSYSISGYSLRPYSLKSTFDGGYMIVGRARPSGKDQAFMMKLDSQTNKVWSKTYGGNTGDNVVVVDDEEFHSVLELSNGYLAIGEAESFNAQDYDEFYVIKTDLQGNTGELPQ